MMICVRQVSFLKKSKVVHMEVFCEQGRIWSVIPPYHKKGWCVKKKTKIKALIFHTLLKGIRQEKIKNIYTLIALKYCIFKRNFAYYL